MRAFTTTAALLLLFTACKHEVETYSSEALTDYLPLAIGKSITYQLDSTVLTNFGRNYEVHHYQERDSVEAPFTDNLGRPGFRVVRSLRDSAGTLPWTTTGVYYITPTEKTVEVVDASLRTVRLTLPIKPGVAWKGNNYLPDDAYGPKYDFSNDDAMHLWDFTYGEPAPEVINGQSIADVLPVYQADDRGNADSAFKATIDTAYASQSFSIEKYAKGIGLVYQELVLWDLEPNEKVDNTVSPPQHTFSPYYRGFAVKRTMLTHN